MKNESIKKIINSRYWSVTPIYWPWFKVHFHSYRMRLHIDTTSSSFRRTLISILQDIYENSYHLLVTIPQDWLEEFSNDIKLTGNSIVSSYEDTMEYLKSQEQIDENYSQYIVEVKLDFDSERIELILKINANYLLSVIYLWVKSNDILYIWLMNRYNLLW